MWDPVGDQPSEDSRVSILQVCVCVSVFAYMGMCQNSKDNGAIILSQFYLNLINQDDN